MSSADSVSADLHLRPCFEEAAHHLREDPLPDALEDPDPQVPPPLGERGEVGLRGGDAGRDGVRVGEKEAAGLRQRHGFGPPGRSTSRCPTIRSSAAICWLTADWV